MQFIKTSKMTCMKATKFPEDETTTTTRNEQGKKKAGMFANEL